MKYTVSPDYGKKNVYRVWDANGNYPDDTSPEEMERIAKKLQAALNKPKKR